MEQIEHDGIEVDRCVLCKGLWFDASEVEALRGRRAAAVLDTGDASLGERTNAIDRYCCPRCSGAMVKMVHPKQSHIWYERCSACHGSFFDAGEFRDLSRFTISDLFKWLRVPDRS